MTAKLPWREHVWIKVSCCTYVAHARSTTTTNHSFSLVVMTTVVVLSVILADHILVLELWQEAAAIQIKWDRELIKLWEEFLLTSTIFVASVAAY